MYYSQFDMETIKTLQNILIETQYETYNAESSYENYNYSLQKTKIDTFIQLIKAAF